MRKASATYRQIAEQLGVTPAAAYKMVKRVLEDIVKKTNEDAKEVLQLELARLDALAIKLNKRVQDSNGTDDAALDRLLKIMAMRSKYLGLEAPAKSEIEMDVTGIPAEVHVYLPDNGRDSDS